MGFFRRLKQEFRFSCQEPLTYPYGCVYTSIAQLFLVMAWSLSLVTISSCYFVNARPIPEEGEPTLGFFGYGLFVREGGGTENVGTNRVFSKCGRYSDFQYDQHVEAAWVFGTIFGVFAFLIGGTVTLIVLTTCCLTFHNNYLFKRLAYVVAGCFGLQVLVFCAYGNSLLCGGEEPLEYVCEWGSGSGINSGAAIFWMLAAFMIFFWPVEEDDEADAEEEPEEAQKPRPNFPALTMGQSKPRPEPQQELPRLTNGRQPRKTNNLRLANESHATKPKRGSTLRITNGEKPRRESTPRLTNGEKGSRGGRK